MPPVYPFNRRAVFILLVVTLAAAGLRLVYPTVVEFRHDEAMLALRALEMTRGAGIPTTGIPSSVGLPNSPVSVYLMALPFAFSANPLVGTLFVMALNVLGVVLLALLVHRYLGPQWALLAGLAYACNPWAVYYSRKIWAQDFHTPLILLALLLGSYGFFERKRWAQVLCLPILVVGAQIHFAGWVLLPLYLWLLVAGRRHTRWTMPVIAVLLAVLTLTPYLAGLVETWENEPDRITHALDRTQDRQTRLTLDAAGYAADLMTGAQLEREIAPEQAGDFVSHTVYLGGGWRWMFGVLTVVGAVGLVRRSRALGGLVIGWAVLPILVFTPTWTALYRHYLIAGIPALAILTGGGAAWLAGQGRGLRRALVVGGMAALLVIQGAGWWSAVRYLERTATPEGFGPPLDYLLDVRARLAEASDVVVLTDGFEMLYDQEPVMWSAMLRDSARCVRALSGDGLAVLPAQPFMVVVAPNAPADPVGGLYQGGVPEVYPLRPGEGAYRVYPFDTAPTWAGPARDPVAPAHFDQGAQLTGFVLQTGLPGRVVLEWTLPGPVEHDYQYFVHLLDADGNRIGQRDGRFWPGRYWCAGDRLLVWTDLDVPPGVRTLRVGLYILKPAGGYVNSQVISAGNAPWADIPLP